MNKIAVVKIDNFFTSPWGNRNSYGQNLGNLASLILNISFAAAGVIILFFIVLAGFKMIQSAGSGDQKSAEQAKQAATSAVIGFVIIFTAFWIIRIIELITGANFITQPGI